MHSTKTFYRNIGENVACAIVETKMRRFGRYFDVLIGSKNNPNYELLGWKQHLVQTRKHAVRWLGSTSNEATLIHRGMAEES